MDLEDILTKRTVVLFKSKREAVECMEFLYGLLGDRLDEYNDKFFYPRAEFYDRCIEYYGDIVGDEPALIVERYFEGNSNRYMFSYCNTSYFKDNFHSAVYYSDICEDLFKVDNAESWCGDVMQLLM